MSAPNGMCLGERMHNASRELFRTQMNDFGTELPWLHDAALVPDDASKLLKVAPGESSISIESMSVAAWMLTRMTDWSETNQSRLPWAEVFEKNEIPVRERPSIRDRFRVDPVKAYGPGILIMAELISTAPPIAARAGLPKKDWAKVASATRVMGKELSQDPTLVQLCILKYLHTAERSRQIPALRFLDPAKLLLDNEQSVTTVTPINDLVAVARSAYDRFSEPVEGIKAGTKCLALQVKAASPELSDKTLFDNFWTVFTQVSDRLIFSHHDIDPKTVAAAAAPAPPSVYRPTLIASMANFVARGDQAIADL